MREHLYKAKRVNWRELPKGEWWVEGNYVFSSTKAYIILDVETDCVDGENTDLYAIEWYEVIKETVCQYTGLPDKNGRKIFEGDIIEIRNKKRHFLSQIEWDCTCGGFIFQDTKEGSECGLDAITPFGIYGAVKVIGNIFDNKELMEEKGDTTHEHDRK